MIHAVVPQPRFCTSADQAGTERLAISHLRRDYGLHPTHMLTASEVTETASGLVGPQGIFCVKGYTRSLAAFTVMVACRECPCIMEAWVALKVISDFLWFPSLLM